MLSSEFPRNLQLRQIDHLEPTHLHGGFGAIFKGELLGRVVAVKEIQAAGRTVEQFLKVGTVLTYPRKFQSHHCPQDFSTEGVVWCHIQHTSYLPFYGMFHLNDGDRESVSRLLR